MSVRRSLCVALLALGLAVPALAGPAPEAAASLGVDLGGQVVGDEPAFRTPHIRDGRINDIAQAGSRMVIAGTFTQLSERPNSTVLSRDGVVAIEAGDGTVVPGFDPEVTNGEILSVAAGPSPGTVYVAGSFDAINGQPGKVALLDTSTGQVIDSFTAPAMNGAITDLSLVNGRLYLGGIFTLVGNVTHQGLVALDPSSGARTDFIDVALAGHHNWFEGSTGAQAPEGVKAFSFDAAGENMVVVGNFTEADGLPRDQIVVIDLTGSQAAVRSDWRTDDYEATCAARAFDSWIRDVAVHPDGEQFTVVTTGGGFAGTLCDTAAKWNFDDSGDQISPVWVDATGGDSLYSVASTDAVDYIGGHQRWANNPRGRDTAGRGAVPRPGLGALRAASGLPIAWNPGRHPRGVGAEVIEATPDGIWVGSDTDWIGNFEYKRPKIAFFQTWRGRPLAPGATGSLPSNVYRAGADGAGGELTRAWYTGGELSGSFGPAPSGDVNWSQVRGAEVVDDELFYVNATGQFVRRAFDGEQYGAAEVIDPYNDPEWSTVDSGRGRTYRGLPPTFYDRLADVRGLAVNDHRLYYTLAGSDAIYSRGFDADSGVLTEAREEVAGFNGSSPGELFIDPDGGTLYYVDSSTGDLYAAAFSDGAITGSATRVSGLSIDGTDWRASALFLADGPKPQQPVASATVSCEKLVCTMDGTGSTDSDGELTTYDWDFGDGATGSGPQAEHTYAESGTYEVSLTVTDSQGLQNTTTEQVAVAGDLAAAERVGVAQENGHARSMSITVPEQTQPGDTLVLFVAANVAVQAGPSGVGDWTVQERAESGRLGTTAYTLTAPDGAAGSTVTLEHGDWTKWDVSLAVFRGVGEAGVETVASTTGTSNELASPTIDVGGPERVVLTHWADRSSSTTAWTEPTPSTVLTSAVGGGGGRLAGLLAQNATDGPTFGPLTAATDATSGRQTSIMLSLTPGR